jgi:hypothetical protein
MKRTTFSFIQGLLAALLAPFSVGCSGSRISYWAEGGDINIDRARVAVLPLSSGPLGQPMTVFFAEDPYYRENGPFRVFSIEQMKRDGENERNTLLGIVYGYVVASRFDEAFKGRVEMKFGLREWAELEDYVGNAYRAAAISLVSTSWKRIAPPSIFKRIAGRTLAEVSTELDVDFVLWGDITSCTENEMQCRLCLFNKSGTIVWCCSVVAPPKVLSGDSQRRDVRDMLRVMAKEKGTWMETVIADIKRRSTLRTRG